MRRDLLLVAISMFTWGLGEGTYLYLQPLYIEKMGAGPVQIGLIYSMLGVAMTIAHIPAGYLADRIGRRPLIWASWLMGLAATWMMALATGLPLFIIGLLTYGVTAFVMSPLNSYVTAASGAWSVQRTLTTISAAYSMGAIIGPWLGGQIAGDWGIRQVYGLAGSIFLLSTMIILRIQPQPIEERSSQQIHSNWRFKIGYWRYLGIVLLALFSTYLSQPLTSNYLEEVQQLSFEQIGLLGSIASLGVTILGLTLGCMAARPAFLLAQVAVGGFTLLLWQGNNLSWFAMGYFLVGGYRVARSMAIAQTRSLVEASQMGLAYGITEASGGIATILAPVGAGILYNRQPALMYPISLVLILISIVISAIFAPRE